MPEIAQQRSKTSRRQQKKRSEKKIYRPVRGKRKLRKMNAGGKLEVVRVGAHNSSDFDTRMLIIRPMGRLESNNKKSRRARTHDILECEGGSYRLDP